MTDDTQSPPPDNSAAPPGKPKRKRSRAQIRADARYGMKLAREAADRQVVALNAEPLITRGADGKPTGVTPAGLKAVNALAAGYGLLRFVATKIGLLPREFKVLMVNDRNLELAFEQGRGHLEAQIFTRLLTQGEKGAFVPNMFALKSTFEHRDSGDPLVQVNLQNNSTHVLQLPASMSKEQYFGMLGAGVYDGRTDQSKPLPDYVDGVRVEKLDGSTKNLPLLENKPGNGITLTGDDAERAARRIEQPIAPQPTPKPRQES